VPTMPGQLAVGCGDEVVAMAIVLADEEHERRPGTVREVGALPPPV
jgi:hypothetical protein